MAAFGARGDGKTMAGLGAIIVHAQEHQRNGYALPTVTLCVRDTFENHKRNIHKTALNILWGGAWRISESGKVLHFAPHGDAMARIELIGQSDASDVNKLRTECHNLWGEEPAPAGALVDSAGITEDAWTLGLTSQRLPSYHHMAIITTNYPDEDHWVWQRFVEHRHAGTGYVRIPTGERASAEDRDEWARALEGRPDLLARLIAGEPGHIALGPHVAVGYSDTRHVLEAAVPVPDHAELWMAHDGGHTPCTIIAGRWNRRIYILAGLYTLEAGMKQHLEQTVLPWCGTHLPVLVDDGSARVLHRWDPSLETGDQGDVESSPVYWIRRHLGGAGRAGPVSWLGRREPLVQALSLMRDGEPVVRIVPGPDTKDLRRALRGRWFYPRRNDGTVARDLPAKPNHPWEDLGDAFCYLLAGMAPTRVQDPRGEQTHAIRTMGPFDRPPRDGGRRWTGPQYAHSMTAGR
jgi:hypothetical protein